MYSRQVIDYIQNLNFFLAKKQKYKELTLACEKEFDKRSYKASRFSERGPVIQYSICLAFSPVNTFLYVTDSLGTLKFTTSGGLQGFKGKSKKKRFQVLKVVFRELRRLKTGILRNTPIAVSLKNVGFQKKFIVRNLKKFLFIKVIKNYQTHPYNGCRTKKKFRK